MRRGGKSRFLIELGAQSQLATEGLRRDATVIGVSRGSVPEAGWVRDRGPRGWRATC